MENFGQELKHWIMNFIFSLAFLYLIALMWQMALPLYYANAPVSFFYENTAFLASDVCFGDHSHIVSSTRIVRGTDVGYPAEVRRELVPIFENDEIGPKIYDERAFPFVEYRIDGYGERTQSLPFLAEGDYMWILHLTLDIKGVKRSDIDPIKSNVFNVKVCDQN